VRQVKVLQRHRILDDFFKVDEAHLTFERYDGTMTPPVRRLLFERGDSVAAVVLHADTGCVLLTEQFRFPTLDKGPGWLLELPAGTVEGGEDPEVTMRRELEEETGFRVERLQHLTTFYLSPGGSSERIWLYFAEVTEDKRVSAGGGVPDEHEDIRLVPVALDHLAAALEGGELVDAKTILGVQWLLRRK
jgi:nudix-type nucleoside diphosphatase (YffH/AdpP family)